MVDDEPGIDEPGDSVAAGNREVIGLPHAVGVAAGDHDAGVVQQPVEQADGGGVLGQCRSL